MTAEFVPRHHDEEGVDELSEPQEVIYDGANAFIRVAGRWTGFFLGDLGGPRGPHDPLWPLDALFGARDDAVEIGREAVRGVAATRCGLTLDLARADAALPSGGRAWTIVELWDFGTAVDITPPRPDEVVPPGEAYQDAREPGA